MIVTVLIDDSQTDIYHWKRCLINMTGAVGRLMAFFQQIVVIVGYAPTASCDLLQVRRQIINWPIISRNRYDFKDEIFYYGSPIGRCHVQQKTFGKKPSCISYYEDNMLQSSIMRTCSRMYIIYLLCILLYFFRSGSVRSREEKRE